MSAILPADVSALLSCCLQCFQRGDVFTRRRVDLKLDQLHSALERAALVRRAMRSGKVERVLGQIDEVLPNKILSLTKKEELE